MGTVSGSWMLLDGKFLGKDATGFDLLVMPGATKIRVPILEESTKSWENANIGDTIQVRVTMDLVQRSGLTSGTTGSRPVGRIGGPITG